MPLSSEAVAFVGVTVVPMDREGVIADQTVLVEGGRIRAIGPSASTAVPASALRIDGGGRYLVPGLVDLHVHLDTAAALPLLLASGVTTVRNLWGSPVILWWRREIAAGRRLGPAIYTAGPIIDGFPPDWSGSTVVETALEAERAVEEQAAAGYDLLKVYNNLTPEVYRALMAAARRRGMPVVGHTPTRVGLDRVLDERQQSIEHLTGYLAAAQASDSPYHGTTGLPPRRHLALHVDPARLARLVARTRAAGVANCVTLTVDQWFLPSAELERLAERPEVQFMPPAVRAAWRPLGAEHDAPPAEYADNQRAERLLGALTRQLVEAGAKVVLGTDSPNRFVVPGFSVHRELANLTAAGLSPYQALRTATRAPAELLGAASEFGAVSVGLRADLLLVEGDPLADVANLQRRVGLLLRGRWLPAEELDALLRALLASYRPPADRFAGLPPLPAEGRVRWRGRWALGMGGVALGEERAVLVTGAAGEELWAQAVTDEPDRTSYRVHLTLGARRAGRALILDSDRPSGPSHLELERQGQRVRLTGTTPFTPRVAIERPLGDDVLLAGPTLADDLALFERLRDLRPGEARTIEAVTLSVEPDAALVDTTYRVSCAHPGQFHIEARVGRSHRRLDVELLPDGRPRRLASPERRGPLEYDLLDEPGGQAARP